MSRHASGAADVTAVVNASCQPNRRESRVASAIALAGLAAFRLGAASACVFARQPPELRRDCRRAA